MPTILTIEDDAAIRQGIVDSLTYYGHGVIEAGDGDAGWKLASEREYDLLLLDLALPGKPGLQILAELRELRPTQPVIICLLYTSPSPRDQRGSRMPSSA